MAISLKRARKLMAGLIFLSAALFISPWSAGAATTYRMTDEPHDQYRPSVSGSRIVWQEDYAGKSSIYGMKLGTQPTRLTGSSSNDLRPRVDGDIVVFERRSPQNPADSDIWMYRFSTGVASPVSVSASTQYGPDISGNRVVWYQFNAASGWDVMLKDLSTGKTYTLTDHPFKSLSPRISGNLVVWSDDLYGQFDIFYYDLSVDSDRDGVPNYRDDDNPWPNPALKRLSTRETIEDKAEVDAGKVVWRSLHDGHYDLFFYDFAAPQNGAVLLREISNMLTKPTITVSDNHVVWTDTPAGVDPAIQRDIYVRNLSTNVTIKLAGCGYRQEAPDLNGTRLVYQDNRNGWQWDVYRINLDGSDLGGSDPCGSDPGGSDPGGSDPGGSDPGGSDPGGSDPGGSDPGGPLPAAPNAVYVKDTEQGRQLKVNWPASTADAYLYEVQRRVSGKAWASVRKTSFRTIYDGGLPQGPRIYYRVRVLDSSGNYGSYSSAGYGIATDKRNPPAPVVRSSTHPNQQVWYKSDDPKLVWAPPPDNSGIRGYSYIMNRRMRMAPDRRLESSRPVRTAMDRAEGIWYFHVRAVDRSGNWGPPAHFRVRIDTHPPRLKRRRPGKLATGIDRDSTVTVKFAEISNIRRRTLNKDTFYLVHSRTGQKVPAKITYDGPNRTVKLKPYKRLQSKMWYRVRLTTGIKDYARWRFRGTGWSFRTGTR